MTNQSNPSPFSTNSASDNIPSATPLQPQQVGEFEIRTMKDDMAKLQTNGIIEEKKTNTVIPPSMPSPPAPVPSPIKPIEPSAPISTGQTEISSEKNNPFQEKTNLPTENIKRMAEVPANNPSSKKSNALMIVVTFVSILIIAIIGMGAYYFISIKKNNTESSLTPPETIEAPATEVTPTATEIQEPVTPVEKIEAKYIEDKPNYLPIDINSLDSAQIKTSIINVSDELKNTSMKSPYEFIIVDLNNNPISFPIFATAAKINFSPELLTSLGNEFSFYIYNDNSNIRTGLNIEIKNEATLKKELAIQEKTLVNDASFMFLNETIDSNSNTFASSSYKDYIIRYSNASATKELSIDYSIVNSKFTLGTSKNTERALIDKITESPVDKNLNQNNLKQL